MWDQARPERAGRSNTAEMTRLDQTGMGEVYHCLNALGPLSPAPEKDHFLAVFLKQVLNKEKLFSGLRKKSFWKCWGVRRQERTHPELEILTGRRRIREEGVNLTTYLIPSPSLSRKTRGTLRASLCTYS